MESKIRLHRGASCNPFFLLNLTCISPVEINLVLLIEVVVQSLSGGFTALMESCSTAIRSCVKLRKSPNISTKRRKCSVIAQSITPMDSLRGGLTGGMWKFGITDISEM